MLYEVCWLRLGGIEVRHHGWAVWWVGWVRLRWGVAAPVGGRGQGWVRVCVRMGRWVCGWVNGWGWVGCTSDTTTKSSFSWIGIHSSPPRSHRTPTMKGGVGPPRSPCFCSKQFSKLWVMQLVKLSNAVAIRTTPNRRLSGRPTRTPTLL